YMVTELMSGGDVEGLIEEAPNHLLPLEQAVKIAQETCRGLEFAHSRGIVHRDLKPGNVWLTADGTAKIGDFGLAISLDRSRLTQGGMMVGTVSYMPPEQAMGGEVTPKSDLYSLGAMLYEMVTGRPPFLGDDSVAIIGQHINTPPVAPTWHNGQCPRPLEALIMRLLAKDPSERPESATDVLSALDAVDLATSVEKPADTVDEAHSLDSLAGGVFVGRQQEMGDLKAALENALSGRGRLVMLVGEPGIGKSRTAQELATYAGLRQAQVLWGRCYEGEGAPPYWPWVQAIRSYVREVDPEQLRSEMGAGAADIGQVVSDVRDRLPGLQAPPQLEPEQARFRLFDSITAFLKSVSRRKPLVLVLDDLHWADQPSLMLLEFVAKELSNARLMIIGTYRDMELSRQHPLSRSLGELTRERLFQRVVLKGLDREDVGRFIELASGVTPPTGLVEAVHRQTEGNPLFVTEIVRLLVQEGELTQEMVGQRDSWSVRIPEGVREVIGRRLDRLSERCNETLTIASVVGREFTSEQLSPLMEDISADRMLEVLEEALSARVIEELPHTVGRYQFTHALIQETLAGELSTTRKVRLHARIAEGLEAFYGADSEAHAAELVHHFAEAQTALGTEKLVHYSLLAGERALASYGYEEALAHLQRGLIAKGVPLTGTVPAEDVEAACLLFGLGRAQLGTFHRRHFGEAIDTLGRAFNYYAETQDIASAVAVAESPIPNFTGLIAEAVAQFETRALALVPPDSPAAGPLLSRHAMRLGWIEADYDGAQEAFEQALAIARRENDIALESRILSDAAQVDFYSLRFQKGGERSLQAVELAQAIDAPFIEFNARLEATRILVCVGESEQSRIHAEAALKLAERLHVRVSLSLILRSNSTLSRLQGDWQHARDFIERGLEFEPEQGSILCEAMLLDYEVGDFDRGKTFLDRIIEGMPETQSFANIGIPTACRISGVTDNLDIAQAAAKAVLSIPSSMPLWTHGSRAALGLIAVIKGDTKMAEEQYVALQSSPAMMAIGLVISSERILGLLAQTMGNLDQAATHFEDALAFCRNAGYRPELAWTCCDYADMLLERNDENNRAAAMALLDESLAISSELGMRPLMERVLSRREILKA
ncbi:MAG: AAA family ATPase, partial [Chloroflexi bacterium]|nr:AAA family ATPase [Chloroflexota bacterium]